VKESAIFHTYGRAKPTTHSQVSGMDTGVQLLKEAMEHLITKVICTTNGVGLINLLTGKIVRHQHEVMQTKKTKAGPKEIIKRIKYIVYDFIAYFYL